MKQWIRLSLFAALTVAAFAWASPGPVHIGPRSPVPGIGQADWDMIHQASRAVARALKLRFGRAFGLHDVPLSEDEDQCLLNRTTQDQLRVLGAFMAEVGDKDGQAVLKRLLESITPTGAGTDWCSRAGHLGENRGLSIYKAGTPPRAEAKVLDAVKEWARGMKGRQPTWQEALAVALAALLAAPVLAPL